MPPADRVHRTLCVEIHDVAPATRRECARLLDLADRAGALPVTLLVVPDHHEHGALDADPAMLALLHARAARGDEIALHGYTHLDTGPHARSASEWFRRRVRTLSEGEFAALPAEEAKVRLNRGLAMLRGQGLTVTGFVPPAWLLGAAARGVLDSAKDNGLDYYALRDRLVRIADGVQTRTLTLSYAAFTAPRRLLSLAVLDVLVHHAVRARIVRFALHPVDARHPDVLAHAARLLSRLCRTHAAATVDFAGRLAAPPGDVAVIPAPG